MKIIIRPLDELELNELADGQLKYPDHPYRADAELGLYRYVNTPHEALGFVSVLQAAKQRYESLLRQSVPPTVKPEYVLGQPEELTSLNPEELKEYLSGVTFGQGCISAIQVLPLPLLVQVLADLSIQAAELYYGISNPDADFINLDGVH